MLKTMYTHMRVKIPASTVHFIETEAIAEGIKALKKRVPLTPDYYDDDDYAKCPSCSLDDFEYGINNWGCKHCPACGQALDWK